ncbi:glycosyltransferase family 1 protein [Collybiopsis luxurians FD-317 M1]|uniref:Glycosyltransferase family 1 protein n=1 Tax=Collybiopsis luxurians FD-317 M1 TaxID=944289 RepID=A0A0D0C0S9_9AGAR|nr:glycosyltransferase family 1 protein [Collybiopsis luxurians FD-317 M1]
MEAIPASQKHILVHAHAVAWGHHKPLVAFVSRLLESRPETIVTYFATEPLFAKIKNELGRLDPAKYGAIKPRLNVIDISGPIPDPRIPPQGFAPAYAALYKSEAVTCLSTGETISGLSPPTLAIIDPFCFYAVEAVRGISNDIPLLSWWTAPVGALLRLLGPPSLGGIAEPSLETPEGRAALKAKIFAKEKIEPYNCVGEVLDNIPGVAPVFDYEWFPQQTLLSDLTPVIEKIGAIYIREADGVITASSPAYEPEAILAVKKWFTSMGKTWYDVGPLSVDKAEVKDVKSDSDKEVVKFLDRVQEEFGEKSLVYISFGTFFFPINPERIWAVFEELIDSKTPFFFAHPSQFAVIPDNIKEQIANSGLGMEMEWSPQEVILSHPATGWFITHGGWNSIQEAFIYRVPLIFWPYQADQPYNATLMSRNHKASFELLTVRTGESGMRLPYLYKDAPTPPSFTPKGVKAELRTILEHARGEEGASIRENFGAIADAMDRSWIKGGAAKIDFEALLERFI